jgi:flagellar motor component MotA
MSGTSIGLAVALIVILVVLRLATGGEGAAFFVPAAVLIIAGIAVDVALRRKSDRHAIITTRGRSNSAD